MRAPDEEIDFKQQALDLIVPRAGEVYAEIDGTLSRVIGVDNSNPDFPLVMSEESDPCLENSVVSLIAWEVYVKNGMVKLVPKDSWTEQDA